MAETEKDALIEKAQLSIIINKLQLVEVFISRPGIDEGDKQLALEQLQSAIAALKQRA